MQAPCILALCLCLVAVTAGTPHPCKSPPLLTGRLTVVYPKGQFAAYERFSYDALGQQIRVRAEIFDHNQTSFQDVLLLYREGVSYEITYQNQTCKKSPLKTPFPPIEIPHNAQLRGEVVLGSSSAPGMGVLVNVWVGAIPEQKAKYELVFTEFGCLPVSSVNYIEDVGLILTSFYDLVLGVEDPDEFIPPAFCDKVEAQPAESDLVKEFLRFFI
nr:epdl2 protein [Petrocephalus simus]